LYSFGGLACVICKCVQCAIAFGLENKIVKVSHFSIIRLKASLN